MKFLIPTEPDDTHAILVKIALEKMDHQATLLFTADQPTRLKNSVYIDSKRDHWKSENAYETLVENNYDVVWWRRARGPYLDSKHIHPADYAFLSRENRLFFEAFTHILAPHAWWVNEKEAAHRANIKLFQLKLAKEVGLTIPETLCSNDPKEIHYFILNHQEKGVIYKPLNTHFWLEKDHLKVSYTSRVHFLDLPNNEVLQQSPGLFQKELKKKYELRITCFGRYIVTARLNSQACPEGELDWRVIREKRMEIEPYELPEEIADKIRLFMQKMGIVFGAFDMIVTPDNEYVFLEVNEQGQFLWLEEYNAAFPMLDLFVHFLIHQSIDRNYDQSAPMHRLHDYDEELRQIFETNQQRHVNLNILT